MEIEKREGDKTPVKATSESNALLGAVQDDLYFALRERDLWMKQCLAAESRIAEAKRLIEGGHDQEAYGALDA